MIPLFQACNASVFDKIIFVLTSATTHNSSYSFELKLFIKTLKLHFLIFFHVTIFINIQWNGKWRSTLAQNETSNMIIYEYFLLKKSFILLCFVREMSWKLVKNYERRMKKLPNYVHFTFSLTENWLLIKSSKLETI